MIAIDANKLFAVAEVPPATIEAVKAEVKA